MTLLSRIGFMPGEIHYGALLSDGRFVVPAVTAGESVWFILDTAQQLDLTIEIGYATERAWLYQRHSKSWGISPAPEVFALGRRRTGETLVVHGEESAADKLYYTTGVLGVRYVNAAVLGLDPISAAVGLSTEIGGEDSLPHHALRVALVPDTADCLPVTMDLGDDNASAQFPHLIVDTARHESVISLAYTQRVWRDRLLRWRARRASARSGKTAVYLRPKGGQTVQLEMRVVERVAPYYLDQLGTHVDGYLGLDFLYRWAPVIDFRRATLWLLPLDWGDWKWCTRRNART